MAEKTVTDVGDFVSARVTNRQLTSTAPGSPALFASASRTTVSNLPGTSEAAPGVRLDISDPRRGRAESRYFLREGGGVYRSGGDKWEPVEDRGELQSVADVLSSVRRSPDVARAGEMGRDTADAIDRSLSRLPATPTLASTHPSNALEPPKNEPALANPGWMMRKANGREQPFTSPDGRVQFNPRSFAQFHGINTSVTFQTRVPFGPNTPPGTQVTVDARGDVSTPAGKLKRGGQEATELLSYAWARFPDLDPTGLERANSRPGKAFHRSPLQWVRPTAEPLALVEVQQRLRR